MAEEAVGLALAVVGFKDGIPLDYNGGIVGLTTYGERYPELWLKADRRIRPLQFGSAILNSVIGHCSIMFHLTGPQILLSRGDALIVVDLQFRMERSKLMLICTYGDESSVEVQVLMKDET